MKIKIPFEILKCTNIVYSEKFKKLPKNFIVSKIREVFEIKQICKY